MPVSLFQYNYNNYCVVQGNNTFKIQTMKQKLFIENNSISLTLISNPSRRINLYLLL